MTYNTWHITHKRWGRWTFSQNFSSLALREKILHVTSDTWHMSFDTENMTWDTWHLTYDTWHIPYGGRWTFSQNFSYLAFRFRNEGLLKIFSQRISEWPNNLMNYWVPKGFVEQPRLHRVCDSYHKKSVSPPQNIKIS